MQDTYKSIVIKFIFTLAVAGIAFTALEPNTWGWVFLIGVIATIVNFIVGDMFILPKYDTIIASIADGVLAIIIAAIIWGLVPGFVASAISLVLFGVLVGLAEFFYHQHLLVSDKVKS